MRACSPAAMPVVRAQDFNPPEIFPGRIAAAFCCGITGTDRPDKPWLNGLPRLIFLGE